MASATMIATIAAGGAIGAAVRYRFNLSVGAGRFGIAGPLTTLLVNIAAGVILSEAWRGLFAVGLLWALTTFSSFALDAGQLWQKQVW